MNAAGRNHLRGNAMEKLIKPLKNEQGYFLIISTLLLLALLTIISIAASNTAKTEVQIAGNDTVYQRNFYLAEGAAMEAVDRLENSTNPRDPIEVPFVVSGIKAINNDNYVDHWDSEAQNATFDTSGETRFVAGYEGTPSGYSLGIGKPRIHEFVVYGRTEKQGVAVIKVGYRKAF